MGACTLLPLILSVAKRLPALIEFGTLRTLPTVMLLPTVILLSTVTLSVTVRLSTIALPVVESEIVKFVDMKGAT